MRVEIRFISSGSYDGALEFRHYDGWRGIYDPEVFNRLIDGYWL